MMSRAGAATLRNPYQRIARDAPSASRVRDWRITFASLEETAARHAAATGGRVLLLLFAQRVRVHRRRHRHAHWRRRHRGGAWPRAARSAAVCGAAAQPDGGRRVGERGRCRARKTQRPRALVGASTASTALPACCHAAGSHCERVPVTCAHAAPSATSATASGGTQGAQDRVPATPIPAPTITTSIALASAAGHRCEKCHRLNVIVRAVCVHGCAF